MPDACHDLGASCEDGGVRFAVWAPMASAVAVQVGAEGSPGPLIALEPGADGVWAVSTQAASAGTPYRFAITGPGGETRLHTDPRALQVAPRPSACAIVCAPSTYAWSDGDWLARRARTDARRQPLSIYELHLGTWRRDPRAPGSELGYDTLAPQLAEHVAELGFTHVELMPLTAHPFPGSWGYQTTGYFAPDPRHGEPDQLRLLIDTLHGHGIGVLLDWVPGHFSPDDWALADFDGTPTYEPGDPGRRLRSRFGSHAFDLGRHEVREFLLDSARMWLTGYHVDGLRVDAVAAIVDPAWGREGAGEREDPDGVAFLRELTTLVPQVAPGAITIAEADGPRPWITQPVADGGLGFDFRWDMGWATDWLEQFGRPPRERRAHHHAITFASSYARSEAFVLALSHDEAAAPGRSLLSRMAGDDGERFAALRALLALQWAHPGKILLFMGCEFAQRRPWSHHHQLDWELLDDDDGPHAGVARLVADLNAAYRALPALWQRDVDDGGIDWIEADDLAGGVYAFARRGDDGLPLVCIANLGAQARDCGDLALPPAAGWRVVLDSCSVRYGGAGDGGGDPPGRRPPLSCIWLEPLETKDG